MLQALYGVICDMCHVGFSVVGVVVKGKAGGPSRAGCNNCREGLVAAQHGTPSGVETGKPDGH